MADDEALADLDAGTDPGLLAIGARCVTFRVDGADITMTLVWRSGQTKWDPVAGQIVFDDRNVGVIRLSNGDRLRFGGAGLADPDSPDQGAPQPTWIHPPDASCPPTRWVVHQVIELDR